MIEVLRKGDNPSPLLFALFMDEIINICESQTNVLSSLVRGVSYIISSGRAMVVECARSRMFVLTIYPVTSFNFQF